MQKKGVLRKTCIAIAIAQCIAAPLGAATIVVNSTGDTSGVVGTCSLRDAITSANNNVTVLNSSCTSGSGSDTIEFTGLSGEISLGSALPTVTSDISLQGPGRDVLTINGNNSHRILHATGSATLTIDSLTLSNGSAFLGGAVYVRDTASVSINDCALTENSASKGGAVASYGYGPIMPKIDISTSTLSGNTAGFIGGAVFAYHGDQLSIESSTLSGNSSNSGGAINAGELNNFSINNSTLSENNGGDAGGAVFIRSSESVSISNSTLSGNSAGRGGAVSIHNANSLSIINSTLSGNLADLRGGAVYAHDAHDLNFSNSILSGNVALASGSEIYFKGGSTATSAFSLLGDTSQSFVDAFTAFTPSVTSIIATATTVAGLANPGATALNSIISPLADNGGLTLTHILVANSPAIDEGDNLVCSAAPILNLDQLGGARPMNSVCDIGSVEYISSSTIGSESDFFVVPVANGNAVIFSL